MCQMRVRSQYGVRVDVTEHIKRNVLHLIRHSNGEWEAG